MQDPSFFLSKGKDAGKDIPEELDLPLQAEQAVP